jgi:hypothetical protein
VAKKRAPRQTIETDPAVEQWLIDATRNRATLSGKQLYEQARIRIDVRANIGIKTALQQAANDYSVSISQMAAALIALGLIDFSNPAHDIHETLDAIQVESRSIRHPVAFDLEKLTTLLAQAFEKGESMGESIPPTNGGIARTETI